MYILDSSVDGILWAAIGKALVAATNNKIYPMVYSLAIGFLCYRTLVLNRLVKGNSGGILLQSFMDENEGI